MDTPLDILVIGATGYTGRLISRYLASHPQRASFTLGLGARSATKLAHLVEESQLNDVTLIDLDVSSQSSLDAAIKRTRVVISTIGPYWTWGTPVVESCVRQGKHYVDLSGESVWIKDIISEFHDAATTTGAMIVPATGWDSLPSDILVYLADKTLKSVDPAATIAESTTAWLAKSGGASGGSLNTLITTIESVPMDKLVAANVDYALSPVAGAPSVRKAPRLVYTLPFSGASPVVGCFWVMEGINKAVVQRTWGLTQGLRGLEDREVGFQYSEFLIMPSKARAVYMNFWMLLTWMALMLIPPVRWIFKRTATQPGNGTSDEELAKGLVVGTNITTSTHLSTTTHIRSVVRGLGDPAYLLTATMVAESALALLLDYESLPEFGRRGGVLTPVTAFGETIIKRLRRTGKMEFESEVVDDSRELLRTKQM